VPSHLATTGGHAPAPERMADVAVLEKPATDTLAWTAEAEKELGKIPFFVRGKARRNTEAYARERTIASITIETLYDAKAHFSR
jgi:light-independent protochlorophyllide reductase subunit B